METALDAQEMVVVADSVLVMVVDIAEVMATEAALAASSVAVG